MATSSSITCAEPSSVRPKRVLIVEDDSDTRLAYHILLKVKEL